MDFQRNLFVAWLFLTWIIWQTWQTDHHNSFIHNVQNTNFSVDSKKFSSKENFDEKNKTITITTDVLSLEIDKVGGDIKNAFLLTYFDTLNSLKPINLLQTSSEFIYQAQSGLIGKDGIDNINLNRPIFFSEKDDYFLENNQDTISVPLTYISPSGLIYTKNFILKRNNFSLEINYTIHNTKNNPLEVELFGQFKQSTNFKNQSNINDNLILKSYKGAAFSNKNNKYKKYSFNEIKRKNLNINTENGWVAILQQYFATAWIPMVIGENNFYSKYLNNNQALIGFKSSPIKISSGETKILRSILWVGPELQYEMSKVAPYLDLTVDYGIFWFISQPLFKLLKFIYNYIGNWGSSIIIITFFIRIILFPLTKSQYTSMAKIRMLQPKIEVIKKRFVNDKKRQHKEIIELYKLEKVNPLGGCLPLIIQMPIFLALYYMLSNSVELRHANFYFWIKDLSSQDPYYILPMLMGITMFLIQKISPNTITDPMQKKIMSFVPLIFTMFFLWFPSGLVLYYIISNVITIIQQHFIYNKLERNNIIKIT